MRRSFLAIWLAILARVRDGANPTLTGMPTYCLTFLTTSAITRWLVSTSSCGNRKKASSTEYCCRFSTSLPSRCITRSDKSRYRIWRADSWMTCRGSVYSLILKAGHPMGIPAALASLLRAITQPSLLDNTTTVFPLSRGSNTRSQETKKLLQSISPYMFYQIIDD